ncbi:hypothetical protein HID58_023831 [Brassica napus]|uniref:Uncharacterized protein n=1 Tax=Brassica napus TaxID=3708 RepID=A0ABQ8D510_BRANA|nr:hypothetical protein HID58_023831 [Brassica napus]
MEGLIPFLYKAMVMYKREGSFSSVFLSDHHSHQLPVTTGDFLATPLVYFERQTSGDFGLTVLDCLKRRLLHHLACPLGTSRNVRKEWTFKYVLPRFSNCSEDSEDSVLIAGSSVHG